MFCCYRTAIDTEKVVRESNCPTGLSHGVEWRWTCRAKGNGGPGKVYLFMKTLRSALTVVKEDRKLVSSSVLFATHVCREHVKIFVCVFAYFHNC